MSTVNKEIADRVIAGEFPEDQIIAILRYENVFNGDYAYKLIFPGQESRVQWILDGKEPNLLNSTIYWRREGS